MYVNRYKKKISHILGNMIDGTPFAKCSPYESCLGSEIVTLSEVPDFDVCQLCLEMRVQQVEGMPFTSHLQEFVDEQRWRFAKTQPLWPHEYIMIFGKDRKLFAELVAHIRKHSYPGRFYKVPIRYFDDPNTQLTYWTMEALPEDTTCINRYNRSESYMVREATGRLP